MSFFVCFFCLFVCPSRYDARHRKPRRFVYALNLGRTGISPPDSFSFRSSFRSRFRFRSRSRSPDKNTPAPGTQQAATYSFAAVAGNLNHSNFSLQLIRPIRESELTTADEFNNVRTWTLESRMIINMQKTKEIDPVCV